MDKLCPYCKGGGFMLSKAQMVVEILKMIACPTEKTIHSSGNMSKEELFAVFSWIKTKEIEQRKESACPAKRKKV